MGLWVIYIASLLPVNSPPFSSPHPECEGNPYCISSAPCPAVSSGFPTAFAEPWWRVTQRCLSHRKPGETKHPYCSCCMDGKPRQRANKHRTTALRHLSLSFKKYSSRFNIFIPLRQRSCWLSTLVSCPNSFVSLPSCHKPLFIPTHGTLPSLQTILPLLDFLPKPSAASLDTAFLVSVVKSNNVLPHFAWVQGSLDHLLE